MPTRTAVQVKPDAQDGVLITWSGLLGSPTDDGDPVQPGNYRDMCVQVTGTFGTGGSVTLQGSLDNVNWFALNTPAGSAITLTAAGLRQVQENARWVRPIVTAGDGTTNLVVRAWVSKGGGLI